MTAGEERAHRIPQIITCEQHRDERGKVDFFHSFDPGETRRIYAIEHPDPTVVRAWQGHRAEKKWFHVTAGRFAIAWVRIDDWTNPSDELVPGFAELDAATANILFVPGGYANGLKALQPDSRVIVFSDRGIAESIADTVRFSADRWFDWETLRPKKR